MPRPPNIRLVLIRPHPASCSTTNSAKRGVTAMARRLSAAVFRRSRCLAGWSGRERHLQLAEARRRQVSLARGLELGGDLACECGRDDDACRRAETEEPRAQRPIVADAQAHDDRPVV